MVSTAGDESDPPWVTSFLTYANYLLLIIMGALRDVIDRLLYSHVEKRDGGYASLLNSWQAFYTRRLYMRIQDCFNRPIDGPPGAWVSVMERDFDKERHDGMAMTTSSLSCLNLGSYNYLGFAESELDMRADVCKSMRRLGVSSCSSRSELGTTDAHLELERSIACFLRKPAAVVFGMGFASNSLVLPALMGSGDLIVSDSLNHSSIVTGVKQSQACVRVFKHNSPESLCRVLREAISRGRPRVRRPWKKILVCVEGLYSMEGAICKLPEIVSVCKRFKAYLFVDEAHSIGALGETGRGVAEKTGVPFDDIDIFMGTFTKSFGSAGGYVASSCEVVEILKRKSAGHISACSMSAACAKQASLALRLIDGRDGSTRGREKLAAIKRNANMFRSGLEEIGLQVIGSPDSPVIPALLFNPAKIPAFSRECFRRKLAVVVVGYPATPLLKARIRFCISAAHSEEDLKAALRVIESVSRQCLIQYKKSLISSPSFFGVLRR